MSADGSSGSTDAGFTLLELLVALALMAVIAATMAVAITQLRPIQEFRQRLDEREAADMLVDAIARDIKAAAMLPLIEAGNSSSVLLHGQPQRIVFSAVVPTGYQRRALREVTYELVRSKSTTQLLRTTRMRRFSQDKDVLAPQVDELWTGEFDIHLSYLISRDASRPAWQDHFQAADNLPKAVSVSLVVAGARRSEATRIVALHQQRSESKQ